MNTNTFVEHALRPPFKGGIFLAYWLIIFFGSLLQAQVPKLPEPADGTYNQVFSYPINRAVPGDLNNDGNLDFVIRSDFVGGTIRIEAKLHDSASTLWSFNTGVTSSINDPLDTPLLCWDFDGDGYWEVYYQYYSGGIWRHRIVNGATGASLVDDAFPQGFTLTKSMVAIAYIGNHPRIVGCIDFWSSYPYLTVFTAWNGSSWSLSEMPGFPYGGASGTHDMINTADIDANTSDDEILAGTVVLNGDGSVRFRTQDLVPNGTAGNSDVCLIGFFDPQQPTKLVYVVGDDIGDNVTAVLASTGELMWNYNMEEYFYETFGPGSYGPFGAWEHWHGGYLRQTDDGALVLAIDRGSNTENWALIDVATGAIVDSDTTSPPYCSGTRPIKWDCDEESECGGVNWDNALQGRYDIGGDGCEEVFGLGSSDSTNLQISFNVNCTAGCASRYDNLHYRQDVARAASGYSPYWSNALVLNGIPPVDDPLNPPIISSVGALCVVLNVTITWRTQEGATSQVEYGPTTSYGSFTPINTNLDTSHRVTITGLQSGATYHFRVISKDVNNNTSTSSDFTFSCACE